MSHSLLCPLAQSHSLILFHQQNAKQSLIIWRGVWSLKMNAVKLRFAGFLPIFLHTEKSGSIYHLYYNPLISKICKTQLFKGQGFFISLFKSLLGKIFPVLYRTSNDQIAGKKIWTKFSFKAFRPEIKFHTNPGLS